MPRHHNKTLATLLGMLAGGLGLHRFYLRGPFDRLGWLHVASVPACGLVIALAPHADPFFKLLPLLISFIAGDVETLVLGLRPDAQFDARYNAGSGRASDSQWPLALLLVLTVAGAGIVTIGTIARLFDLLYTGGAYG